MISLSLWVLIFPFWIYQAAPAGDDDDDLDLFGDETEEEKKAAEEREASVKASSKKKESKLPFVTIFTIVNIKGLNKIVI